MRLIYLENYPSIRVLVSDDLYVRYGLIGKFGNFYHEGLLSFCDVHLDTWVYMDIIDLKCSFFDTIEQAVNYGCFHSLGLI